MSLRSTQQKVTEHILEGKIFEDDHRIFVYEGGYYARFVEALSETYDSIQSVVGEGGFEKLVYRYVQRHPSRSYNLFDSGEKFAEFIRTDELMDRYPFLYDLARLEWQIALCFHSRWEEPISQEKLTQYLSEKAGRVQFHFQKGMSLISSSWNFADIRIGKQPILKTQFVKVWRVRYQMQVKEIDAGEKKLLESLMLGRTLDQSLAGMNLHMDPSKIQSIFRDWFQHGLIVGVK